MTPRHVVLLLPLLALLVVATYALPPRPDDEAGYVALAQRLTEGRYTTGNDAALLDDDPAYPDLWFGPGLPALLAPLVALDLPLELLRLLGPLSLWLAALALLALLRRRVGDAWGLAGAYSFGLYPPSYTLLPNLHSEPLAILCLVVALLAMTRFLERGRPWDAAVAGLGFAGLALTRVAFGWVLTVALIGAAIVAVVSRGAAARRTAGVLALGLALCLPWLAYTQHVTGRPLVWGNSGSLSLYWMSSPYKGEHGDWHRADAVFTDDRLASHRPFFRTLEALPLAEQNERLEREALRHIVDHPGAYAGNVLANVSRMIFNAPYSFEQPTVKALLYAIPNAFLLVALAASVVLLARRGPPLPPETLAVVLVGGANLGLHALVASYPRMLTPLVPLVVWAAAVALVRAGIAQSARGVT